MKYQSVGLLACGYLAAVASPTTAQTERDLGSHEHGASIVNVVMDEDAVFVEFESPWMNLVGFEHTPSTPEQHALLDEAKALLEQPDQLFSINAEADCRVESVQVRDSHDDAGEHDDHAEHGEHEDHAEEHEKHEEHAEAAEHAEHEEHAEREEHAEHEKHAEHEEGSSHSEVISEYAYTCGNPSNLTSITLSLVEQWQGIVDIDVQLAGPAGQTAFELSADQTLIDLSLVK